MTRVRGCPLETFGDGDSKGSVKGPAGGLTRTRLRCMNASGSKAEEEEKQWGRRAEVTGQTALRYGEDAASDWSAARNKETLPK